MAEREHPRITGVHALSALGRGGDALLAGVLAGTPAFAPVRRFDTAGRRVAVAATLPEAGALAEELADAIDAACRAAGLDRAGRADSALFLATHGGPRSLPDPAVAGPDAPPDGGPSDRVAGGPAVSGAGASPGVDGGPPALAGHLSRRGGLGGRTRVYTTACVSASTAVADAAALIARGDLDRVVVAAGYLVEPDQYALFDAGRAFAADGAVRPFSAGRQGLLLGDGVAAVVLESAAAVRHRGATPVATVAGWGRAGDAYHPCQPDPRGRGLARAVAAALGRAGLPAEAVGYVNANATGTPYSDASEAAALRLALGDLAGRVPVSSTKSVHGHALEASGLLELVVTVLALRHGKLPVNAGWLGPDESCPLDVITQAPRPLATAHALTLNAAFGGANTALLVGAP
ncbi:MULTISPECIES: beta-ketoacyl synthase [Micromonospora]|uniref:Beta-ketoacyl-[acyl-carrier-protein] synthase family protein n=1 Tax=Micromonospora solifontis TaxID=2487138 RepID=A0ABX9WAU2_9ACTN|nr:MULTISPECIES: beta-ketoacyl synthase N-terminal-like domain-containing protein [Micromonospora]NES13060.1 beta-ketoacyl-[acyl-carrier-protein] synthase family protein [Micromonospora sp. PPF5-17B]NES38844.1 beta-ketoacyl-[acyl-carrier-protein] synthase family protein [Micromonospora solifontis]NES54985.1 beta-ketoacyl-[acyl-carrier-protein] synthase family protein [Micromonospora sp. PPF5-6]RNL92945.1 beta-ketoacyl-[acyl-carrier-protein] synthase family protein [Micromonospora solifontis]